MRDHYLCYPEILTNTLVPQPGLSSTLQNQLGVALDALTLVLINSVLTSMPMFLLYFFEVPKGVRKRLDFFRSRFLWQSDEAKKKYGLTRWDILCRPKDQGVLVLKTWK